MKTILYNAKIYIEKNVFQEAVLIEDGVIKAIGPNKNIMLNNADKIIDLQGKTVIPGLNDSHLHIAMVGESMKACILTSAKSIDDIIIIGKDYLENCKNPTALHGKNWNQDYFTSGEQRMPTRHDLDKISSEIPIVLERVCGHVVCANTKSLELLGIDENTEVGGGEVIKGSDGKPNGIFTENATRLLLPVLPDKSLSDRETEILNAANYALSTGVTSVQSCDVMSKEFKSVFKIIHNIYDNGKTKLRYNPQFNFQDIDVFKEYLETEHINGSYDGRFLSRGALKLFKDGSLGARTALMTNDYNDAPGIKGVPALSDQQLQALCDLATENWIRVVTHAIGDGAVESVINAYERTMKRSGNTLRHGIVHCQITNRSQIERIARLNIPVMLQPIFLDYDIQIVESRVGRALAETSYAFNTLNKLDAPISFGTDSPVEDLNPFPNIYSAVTRQRMNLTPEKGFIPGEKMSVEDAVDAYTIGSAFNEFKENEKGRLKPGFAADLAVLDSDIFTIDHNKIKDIKVIKTMVDGDFVFEM